MYYNGRVGIWIRDVCYKRFVNLYTERPLLLLVTSTIITVFSANPAFSEDTVYIGGSGKVSVQVDLSSLDGNSYSEPSQYSFEFTNSLDTFETFDPIQLKVPNIDQHSSREKRNDQLKLSETDSSKMKQNRKTNKALTINKKKPEQRPRIQSKSNKITPDTPDQAINFEQNKVARHSSTEPSGSLNKKTDKVTTVDLAIDNSWKITFIPEEANLTNSSLGILTSIVTVLNQDDKFRLQLKAYASDHGSSASHARRLSLTRALAVRSFLIKKGIRSTRIDVRALGDRSENGKIDRVDVFLVKN